MKVLVTGATSGLGRNAAQWLLEAGHEVYAIGRDQLAGEELRKLGATFIPLDLTMTTMEVCQQWVKTCDVVWHCAAKSAPWGNPQDFHQTNVVVTHNLLRPPAARGLNGSFISHHLLCISIFAIIMICLKHTGPAAFPATMPAVNMRRSRCCMNVSLIIRTPRM